MKKDFVTLTVNKREYTFGVNYYVTDNIVARLNYSYQKLNQEYTKEFMLDKNLHSIQARVAFEF